MGRDERFFKAMQARQQQAQIARASNVAIIGAAVPVLDRLGQKVEVGDVVLFEPPVAPFYTVAAIEPINHPNAPRDAMKVVLQCQLPISVRGNQNVGNLVIVAAQGMPQESSHADRPESAAAAPAGDGQSISDADRRDEDPSGVDSGRREVAGEIPGADAGAGESGESGRLPSAG